MESQEKERSLVTTLIINFLSGNISSDELQQLDVLLKNNPENQQLYSEIKISWDVSGSFISENSQESAQRLWDKLKKDLLPNTYSPKAGSEYRFSIFKIIRLAALWILVFSLGSFTTWFIMKTSGRINKGQICTVSTPLGSKSHVVLPDGTEVWLNAGSNVRYHSIFSQKQRDIYLSGEAYFKVVSNKKWPFVVHTPELNIRAVGTSFNVKAYPSEKSVTTTLVEGIVELESGKRNFSCTLKPKQELVFLKERNTENSNKVDDARDETQIEKMEPLAISKDIFLKKEINTEPVISWKDQRWIIDGESVESLAVMLERRYNMKINIISDELRNYKFSGTIENETFEQVLKYLSLTIPLKYTLTKENADLIIDNTKKEADKIFLKTTIRNK